MARREVFCWCFMGDNRTGKSVEAAKMAIEWKKNNPEGKVIAHDPQNRFGKSADIIIQLDNENWAEIVATKKHVLLILDELKLIHPSTQASKGVNKLMANRGEHAIDIIYIIHNPGFIINSLAYFTSWYFIFYTNTHDKVVKEKIPNKPELVLEGIKYMNNYIKTKGEIEYPGPFPYIIADIKNDTLTAINLK